MSNPGFPSVPGFAAYNDGSYCHADLLSTQANTAPSSVGFWGPITAGDVIGFDYHFTYSGTTYTRSYRHTMTPGDTHWNAINDLAAQFKGDLLVNAAIGDDIVSYAYIRRAGPTNFFFQFFQSWPFVNCGPTLAVYLSPGATEGGAAGIGGTELEANPYFAFGRTVPGRAPQTGDDRGGFYFIGDSAGKLADLRNCDPLYAQMQVRVKDPTDGVTSGVMTVTVDTVNFEVSRFLVNGAPTGAIGVQGPPGGNLAGSVMQSPSLKICADAANPNVNFVDKRVYKLAGMSIAGWTTIATVTPSNVAGSWSIGKIRVEIEANTHGVGFGVLDGQVYVSVANGAPSGNWFGPVASWGSVPQFRFIGGPGNSLLMQIGSSDGVHAIASGKATITYSMSDAEGNPVTWTIQ